MPFVKMQLCIGCGICVQECPVEAIDMKNQRAVIDQDKCIKCGRCIDICPKQAIRPNSENPQLRGHGSGRMRRRRGGR